MNRSPTFKAFIPTFVVLNLFGWGGLITILNLTQPSLGYRILFFVSITTAFTGISLPAVIFLNRRFPTTPAPNAKIFLREAMWVGVYFSILAWLAYGRVINFGLGLIFLFGIIALEFFLRMREKSIWQKPSHEL